jgi:hypothetical protein
LFAASASLYIFGDFLTWINYYYWFFLYLHIIKSFCNLNWIHLWFKTRYPCHYNYQYVNLLFFLSSLAPSKVCGDAIYSCGLNVPEIYLFSETPFMVKQFPKYRFIRFVVKQFTGSWFIVSGTWFSPHIFQKQLEC